MDLTLPDESTIAVAGDWHGNSDWLGRVIPGIARGSKDVRTILHLGDFGIYSGTQGRKYLDNVDRWCGVAGLTRILVTPGNHEDWGWLDSDFAAMPGEPVPISKTVSVLPRGFRFSLAGVSFMSFGGAASVDYQLRSVGDDWFLTETPTDADVELAIAGGPVDVLLTHETVLGGTAATESLLKSNPQGWPAEALRYSAESRERVTRVWAATSPRLLVHGHMHVADELARPDGSRVISLGRDEQARNAALLHLPTLDWQWL